MIYIFDDKRNRQKGYKWTNERFEFYKDFVTPIHEYSEVDNLDIRNKLFAEGSVILFHESFFDADFNRHYKEAVVIRRDLEDFASNTPNFFLAFFSGSKSSRLLKNNIAYLPVSILYQNLEEFIIKSKTGSFDLKYLLFGRNPNIEIDLVERLSRANASLLTLNRPFTLPQGLSILIATTVNNDRLPQIVTGARYSMYLSSGNDVDIHKLINDTLKVDQYDKIFIPLCFGTCLSDFNGLKLAVHIRCTDTINKCVPIYIYSFVEIDELINHEFFNVLKQKNVQLIDYSVKAFDNAINSNLGPLKLAELQEEVAKLKLDVPSNYEDNHSIANEWAVFRWAMAVKAENSAIQKIIGNVNSQLYFKYLNTIYTISEMPSICEKELQIIKQGQPKILYIDDDAEKGWSEILCKLLSDINNIEKFDYLGDEIKLISQQEIIDKAVSKVLNDDIDLVILDLRLHPNDFIIDDIKEFTGLKILKALKNKNPGIQVIIFTASNKVWNFQELQNEGADGFVFKEGPENSVNSEFTYRAIKLMLSTLQERIESCFLKSCYKRLHLLEKELLPRVNFKRVENPLPKEFVYESLKWFKLSIDYLRVSLDDSKKAASFLFMFSVLENLSTRIIDVDNPIDEGNYRNGRKVFKFEFRSKTERLRNYIEDEENTGFYRRTDSELECIRAIPWNIKILNTLDFITNDQIDEQLLSRVVKKRNDFVHSNTTTGNRFSISTQDIIWLNEKIFNGLISVI